MDAINWNLLYRWFCDLDPDPLVWDATTFTKNRERFQEHGLVQKFVERVVETALVNQYAANDHFTGDGTLIQSWASLKSFRPKEEPRGDGPAGGGSARRRMLRRMKTLGYRISQKACEKVEQVFGWLKQPGGLRRVRHVGRWKIQQVAYRWGAAYNLLRLALPEARLQRDRENRRKEPVPKNKTGMPGVPDSARPCRCFTLGSIRIS